MPTAGSNQHPFGHSDVQSLNLPGQKPHPTLRTEVEEGLLSEASCRVVQCARVYSRFDFSLGSHCRADGLQPTSLPHLLFNKPPRPSSYKTVAEGSMRVVCHWGGAPNWGRCYAGESSCAAKVSEVLCQAREGQLVRHPGTGIWLHKPNLKLVSCGRASPRRV